MANNSILFILILMSSFHGGFPLVSPTLDLDLNDILRADLMPTTFLMFDGGLSGASVDSGPGSNVGNEDVDIGDGSLSRQGGVELGPFSKSNPFTGVMASPLVSTNPPKQMLAVDRGSDGDFLNALQTMRFHRHKYNEYLCNNFLASQILSEVLMPAASSTSSVAFDNHNQTNFSNRMGFLPIRTPMFNSTMSLANPRVYTDIGSHGYQNWLEKTSAFENANEKSEPEMELNDGEIQSLGNMSTMSGADGSRRHDFYDYPDSDGAGDYVEGYVEGYADPKPSGEKHPLPTIHHHLPQQHIPLAINHGIEEIKDYKHTNTEGRRTLHKDLKTIPSTPLTPFGPFPPPPPTRLGGLLHEPISYPVQQFYAPQTFVIGSPVEEEIYSSHDHHHHLHAQDYKHHKSMGLKEIFEIALTTLAFLAFGMFMLQVIMCISMEHSGMEMVTPMEGSVELDAITEEVRKKRAVPVANMERINELAKIVLVSIESTYSAKEDKGQCLFRTLCEANKLSRRSAREKYWIPLWGLGMTWYAPRVIQSQSKMHSILDGIKASFLGLGNADCAKVYAKCSLKKLGEAKERYRKKRSVQGTYEFKW